MNIPHSVDLPLYNFQEKTFRFGHSYVLFILSSIVLTMFSPKIEISSFRNLEAKEPVLVMAILSILT